MPKLYRLLSLLSGLLLLASRPVRAQQADTLRQALDNVFAPLDKNQVPAPFLAEYGNRLTSLTPYNGTLTDSSVATLTSWRLLYASLLSGNVGRASSLPLPADVNTTLLAQQAASPTVIPLLVQCLDYASLRPDAISAGLLTVQNGQLRDVPNRSGSPYAARKLFAVAPAVAVSPTGAVSFQFTPGLHLTTGGAGTSNVRSLSLDFGDGQGYQAVAWNTPISTQYCSAGTKRVKVRITYGDSPIIFEPDPTPEPTPYPSPQPTEAKSGVKSGVARPQPDQPTPSYPPASIVETYESWFDITVQQTTCGNNYRYSQSDVAELRQVFAARGGVHSGGTVYVRFGGNRAAGDRTIRRPLIVAEGYDGYSAAPAVYLSNYGIQNFLNDIGQTSLYNNLETAPGSNGITGYDLIYIDYNNGTDDIRRNAALFEEVVRWVNSNKVGGTASGERNVVLGVSMGGLVARYGLAEMVKNPNVVNGVNQNDPHTRLLVTHDSPHRGANTPLGIQMLVRQAAGTMAAQLIRAYNNYGLPVYFPALSVLPELQQLEGVLDAPATQQLLLVRGRRSGIGPASQFSAEYNSFLDNTYRPMITPTSGTLPYRFVATSLGSQCGTSLFNPYTELIRVERSGYLGIIGLTTGYKTEVIVNALPVGGRVERISSLRVWNETRILGISLGRIYLTNFSFNSPSSNPTAWDGLPGGTQAIAANVGTIAQGSSFADHLSLIFVWGSASNTYLADKFCFVPRASALDVVTLDQASLTRPYVNGAAGGSASRASAFIAHQGSGTAANYNHPYFPARQGQWLYNLMQNDDAAANQVACTTDCTALDPIAGPEQVCAGATATYQLNTANVTWTVSPSQLFTVSSGTGSTFSTSAVAGAQGTATITATFPCGSPLTKTIKVGPGEASGYFYGGGQGNTPLGTYQFVSPGQINMFLNSGYTFTFQSSNPSVQLNNQSGGYTSFYLPANKGTTITATSTSGSTCGLKGQFVFTNGSGQAYVTTSPNPASSEVSVMTTEAADDANATGAQSLASPQSSSDSFEAVLYDSYGRRIRGQRSDHGKVRLDVRDLPNGLYNLRVGTGKTALLQHIQVAH